RLAARLRDEAAASTVYSDGQPLHYTLSLGLTTLTPQDASLDVAIARADEALYRAKMGGRNRIEVEAAGQST
ncbi:MAG: diguanylate cyclase domain-containing protein, partial [Halothiobacillaceae bacterium]